VYTCRTSLQEFIVTKQQSDVAQSMLPQHSASLDSKVDIRKLFSIAISAGGVQAMTALVGIFTVKIVSVLGADTLAAVIGGQRLYFIMQAVLLGLNVGCMALVARSMGQQDEQQALRWLRLSLLLALLMTTVLSCGFMLFAEPLLAVVGLQGEAQLQAAAYIRSLSLFIWGIGIYMILAGALRAMGYAWIPLCCGLLLNLLTLCLTYALVHSWPGLLGGAASSVAIAAGIGSLLGLLLMLGLLLNRWRSYFIGPWFSMQGAARLWQISYPAMLEQLLRQGSVLAFLWVVASYGNAAYAAYGAGIMLMALSFVIGFGFSVATAVMVGQALGQGSVLLARKVLQSALLIALLLMSTLGIVLGIFSQQIASWLVADAAVAYYTGVFIFFFALIQPLMAIDFVATGALQGRGDTRWPFFTVLISHFGVRFGLALLCLWLEAPAEWVFATIVCDYLVKTLLVCWRVFARPGTLV